MSDDDRSLPFTPDERRLLLADLQGAADHYADKVARYDGTPVADADGLRKRQERAGRLRRLRRWVEHGLDTDRPPEGDGQT